MALDKKGQQAYKNYMEDERHHNSMVWSRHQEARLEGLRKRHQDEKIELVKNALQEGLPLETIALITQLEVDDVRRIEQE